MREKEFIDNYKLKIELIPQNCWNVSLRNLLKTSDWNTIRKEVYSASNYHCQICGEKFDTLDAHEVWDFDEQTHTRKLINIIGVCKACHTTIHFGRAQKLGFETAATEQFLKVNCCNLIEFKSYQLEILNNYRRLNEIDDWNLDLSYILNQGYELKTK